MTEPAEPNPIATESGLAPSQDDSVDAPVIPEREYENFTNAKGRIGVNNNADLWKDYDREKARAALLGAAGILKGIDLEQFMAELLEQRRQDSTGRNDLEYLSAKLNG